MILQLFSFCFSSFTWPASWEYRNGMGKVEYGTMDGDCLALILDLGLLC
jgi:hypothetical protein